MRSPLQNRGYSKIEVIFNYLHFKGSVCYGEAILQFIFLIEYFDTIQFQICSFPKITLLFTSTIGTTNFMLVFVEF